MNNEIMQALLSAQQEAFEREAYVAYGTRIDRLNRCIAMLVDQQEKICDAINSDFGNRSYHVSFDDMPFGGIGKSGMGNYHGFDGFQTFSHAKSVFKQGFVNLPKLAGTLPPYTNNVDKLMEQQIRK